MRKCITFGHLAETPHSTQPLVRLAGEYQTERGVMKRAKVGWPYGTAQKNAAQNG